MINFKFSALPYAAIVAGVYFIYLLFKRDWKLVRDLLITGVASLIIGLLVIGASSYVMNTVRNQNPVYPLAGEGSIDIMAIQQPISYRTEPGIKKFIASNFLYETNNISYDPNPTEEPGVKLPFTINLHELSILHGMSDARQAGYGVWFGGILMVSIVAGVYLLARYGRRYKEYLPFILLPLATIAITVVVFDNSWWARYLPQFILLPVIVLIALFALKSKILPYVLAFMLFFNIILTGLLEIHYQAALNKSARASISQLECDTNTSAKLVYDRFYGAVYNIRDHCENIEVTYIKDSDIPKEKLVELYREVYLVK